MHPPFLWRRGFPRARHVRIAGAGPTAVAVLADDRLIVLDAATGVETRSAVIPRVIHPTPDVPPGNPPRFLTLRYGTLVPTPTDLRRPTPLILDAWAPRGDGPAWSAQWSAQANPRGLVGDGERVAWNNDDEVVCADHATGRVLWRLPAKETGGGEPVALAGGRLFLRSHSHDGAYGQFLRVLDAGRGGARSASTASTRASRACSRSRGCCSGRGATSPWCPRCRRGPASRRSPCSPST